MLPGSIALSAGALCAVAMSLAASAAFGAASGLVVIPTADTVPAGEFVIEPQFDTPAHHGEPSIHIINTEVGIDDRIEAGIDYHLSTHVDRRTVVNAKYVFPINGKRNILGAFGIDSFSTDMEMEPYALATFGFGKQRLHVGTVKAFDAHRWFVGVDYSPSDCLTLMADHTSGSENPSSLGFEYWFTDRFALLAGVLIPNTPGPPSYTLHLTFGGRYRR